MTDDPRPIHLTGDDADRMTEAEREAVRERIRAGTMPARMTDDTKRGERVQSFDKCEGHCVEPDNCSSCKVGVFRPLRDDDTKQGERCRVCARGGPCAMHDENVRVTPMTDDTKDKCNNCKKLPKEKDSKLCFDCNLRQEVGSAGAWLDGHGTGGDPSK